jgi:pSer/pThr/pTyr-binding forkhead associated (FHA) protein
MEMADQPGSGEGAEAEKLRLKVAAGNAAGTVIEVEEELVIGRQAAGAGTLGNDIEISRQHARIATVGGGRYAIEDLGSTNGTTVNGRRIDSPTTLEAGDRIEVGASELIVQVGALRPTPTSTPVSTITDQPQPAQPEPAGASNQGAVGGDAEPAPQEEAGPERFALRIEVDLEAGEATVALDEGADQVTLHHRDGRWKLG